MKGADNIKMTLHIGNELIQVDVDFDDQYKVREAERDVKLFCDKLRKSWPDSADSHILAMAAYQFARWYRQLLEEQNQAIDMAREKCLEIEHRINDNI
ncbi:MAG: hypothetical protein J1F43_06485 [Muribaculaceae bacterium]|nr:hypothetical protein [Muribaculaceae bacterium]